MSAGRDRASLAGILAGDPVEAAVALLGASLVSGPVTLRLTEVEAYAGAKDPASHAFRGPTQRNAVMFGEPGHAYVYFTYGMHWCLNVVCGPVGTAAAVLLRAGQVVRGNAVARSRRPSARAERELASGPARLCQALGVDRAVNGVDLLASCGSSPSAAGPIPLAGGGSSPPVAGPSPSVGGGPILLPAERPVDPAEIASGPRVGVTAAADRPWRFWIAGDPTVSRYRRHQPRQPRHSAAE